MNGSFHDGTDGPSGRSMRAVFFSRYQTLFAALAFLCLSAYAMGANPFKAETVAPLDLLMYTPGWSTVQPVNKVVHIESTDILDSQLPVWITLKAQVRSGQRPPLWYPYALGGSTADSEFFNPLFLLFLVIKDNALAYYLVGVAKLVISGFGGYLLLRMFLRWLPSLWGGMVYMLCGFHSAWFFWEKVGVAMWIPWLLWTTVRYLKSQDRRWLPAITLISFLFIVGQFPAVAAYGFYSFALLVFVWNVHRSLEARKMPFPARSGILKRCFIDTALPLLATGIAFVLSGIILIPFIDYMSGINLSYRIARAESFFSYRDLLLFMTTENPQWIERTAFIGVPAVLLSFLGMYSAFRAKDENLKRFSIFSLLLAIISILIVFAILPPQLIRLIPVFNTNTWSRLIVITHLALALLSAIGLDSIFEYAPGAVSRYLRITPFSTRRLLTIIMIMIAVLQFHSQKKLFNSFNAVVPSAWLYPATPSITYVKENLMPLQSVIADYSFCAPGILGAYGIAEWYGHSFRSDTEQRILSSLVQDPFTTATTAFITNDKAIRFDSPLMNQLAVKHVLINRDRIEPITTYTQPVASQELSPPLPGNVLKQHISLPGDMLISYFAFYVTTEGGQYAPARVRLEIFKDDDPKPFAVQEISRFEAGGNSGAFFRFPTKKLFAKGSYSLILSLVDYRGPHTLSVRATKSGGDGSYLEVNGRKTDLSLQWAIGACEQKVDLTPFAGKWRIIDRERDIVILENKDVTNSAYYVQTLDGSQDAIRFTGLDVRQPTSELVEVNNHREDPGWIILPMHLSSDWKAYVDGKEVAYDAYLGMLPAIPVKGPCRVMFRFEPQTFRKGAPLSAFGLILYSLFTAYCIKYGNRRKQI